MQHGGRAERQLLGHGLQLLAQRAQRTVPAVPHRDHEVGAGEDHDLAGLHDLTGVGEPVVVDIADGLEDGEQRVVVVLQLRPLMGVDRVLDGERMEPEQLDNSGEFLLGRLMQPDPDKSPAGFPDPADRHIGRVVALLPYAVHVHRAVHHGGTERRARRVAEVDSPAARLRQPDGLAEVADHRHRASMARGRPRTVRRSGRFYAAGRCGNPGLCGVLRSAAGRAGRVPGALRTAAAVNGGPVLQSSRTGLNRAAGARRRRAVGGGGAGP